MFEELDGREMPVSIQSVVVPFGGADVVGWADRSANERAREHARWFEKLMIELRPQLYRYAYWLSRDPALAEDVVQEALIRGWRSLETLKDERAAKQWLLTIVRREHARVYERKRLETTDIDELSAAEHYVIATNDNDDVDAVREALMTLQDEYREPLVLQVLMGYTAEEIGKIMGIKTGAVLTRLCRARRKLATRLAVEE